MSETKTLPVTFHRLNLLACSLLLVAFCGCATQKNVSANSHPFSFEHDTFSYANELSWEYFYDAEGKWRSKKRQPAPEYTQHCFVVARAARQFIAHARFDKSLPRASAQEYEMLVRKTLARSFTKISSNDDKVVLPGYPDLREFSRDHAALLKQECGSSWHSYVQRGHWRMMMPFSANGQEKMALRLASKIKENAAPIIHLVRFPQLTINHAAVLYGVTEDSDVIRFSMYDPNYPEKPATLTFDRQTKHFILPANTYFQGGQVNVYEIYKSFCL
ncbi:MAG: hypothetical protein JWM68_4834 [Verrucomicrobiales bacterium]|nr:hypothetical protein [Verrucomicrobiales bacterium]